MGNWISVRFLTMALPMWLLNLLLSMMSILISTWVPGVPFPPSDRLETPSAPASAYNNNNNSKKATSFTACHLTRSSSTRVGYITWYMLKGTNVFARAGSGCLVRAISRPLFCYLITKKLELMQSIQGCRCSSVNLLIHTNVLYIYTYIESLT